MENKKKEQKFISLVVYLNNVEKQITYFLDSILPVVEEGFTQYELICVNDGCTDGTIEVLKEYLSRKKSFVMVNIIHMSFFHGLESAMNAGRDLAIGDFVYEFDNVYVDYSPELLNEVYHSLLEGNDIVAAGSRGKIPLSSRLFYHFYNKTSRSNAKIGPESFRIVSRRAINRIKSIGQYIPYRKAIYSSCGLNQKILTYEPLKGGRRFEKKNPAERAGLALDSFIYFTNAMERVSATISCLFLIITIGVGIYIGKDFMNRETVVEGWMSTMGFLSIGFFGVFTLLTIVMKYLSVMLNLIFKQQRYLISEIEKVVKE